MIPSVLLVVGALGRRNWVLHRSAPVFKEGFPPRCVIFFPGDISDFASDSSNPQTSLEALTTVIAQRFPTDDIVTVRPEEVRKGFAHYSQFVATEPVAGVPSWPPEELAVEHLEACLADLSRSVGRDIGSGELIVLAFSKGGVALNSLIKVLQLHGDEEMLRRRRGFWHRTVSAHYIDVGLSEPGAYPISEAELQALNEVVAPGFELFIHGTPRQMADPRRPFISQEAAAMATAARAAGIQVYQFDYGAGRRPSIDMHWDSLACFRRHRDDAEAGDRYFGSYSSGWTLPSEICD